MNYEQYQNQYKPSPYQAHFRNAQTINIILGITNIVQILVIGYLITKT